MDEGGSSNYGKSVDYKYVLKGFLLSPADRLHLEKEEKRRKQRGVSRFFFLSSGENEVPFTEEKSGGRNFFFGGRQGRKQNSI